MLCPKCGAENPEGSIMCNGCGYIIDTSGPLSGIEERTEEKADGHVKFTIKKRKPGKDFSSADDLQSINDGPKPASAPTPPEPINVQPKKNVSVGTKNRFFSGNSHSTAHYDIREALAQEVRPRIKKTEYENRYIKDLPEEVMNAQTVVTEEETIVEDKKLSYIILAVLEVLAIIVSLLISTRIKNIALYREIERGFRRLIGNFALVKAIPFLIYIALIYLLAYDSLKHKDENFKKSMKKYVIASGIIAIVSVLIAEGLAAFSDGNAYFSMVFRFLILILILAANNYFKKFYTKIEKKAGLNTILFEFLLYYIIFTLIVLVFIH